MCHPIGLLTSWSIFEHSSAARGQTYPAMSVGGREGGGVPSMKGGRGGEGVQQKMKKLHRYTHTLSHTRIDAREDEKDDEAVGHGDYRRRQRGNQMPTKESSKACVWCGVEEGGADPHQDLHSHLSGVYNPISRRALTRRGGQDETKLKERGGEEMQTVSRP